MRFEIWEIHMMYGKRAYILYVNATPVVKQVRKVMGLVRGEQDRQTAYKKFKTLSGDYVNDTK